MNAIWRAYRVALLMWALREHWRDWPIRLWMRYIRTGKNASEFPR
jgi:hypothetical protein